MHADPSSSVVLSRDALLDIGHRLLSLSTADTTCIELQHTARAVTRVSHDRVLTSDSGDTLSILIRTMSGAQLPVRMQINQIDESSLQFAMRALNELTKVQFGAPVDYLRVPDGPQHYLPVSLWHDTTAAAITTSGDTSVPLLIDAFHTSNIPGAGFIGVMARSTLVMQEDGLIAFNQETDSECSVSAWSPDRRASGWSGHAARDWSTVRPGTIAAEAIELAKRGMNPVAVEPGRRTVILSRFAVAQIMRHLSPHFDAYQTNVYASTAFAVRGDTTRVNKVGRQVFDPTVNMSIDPADPLGGFIPFGDVTGDWAAMPTHAVSLVERGVLRDLTYSIYYGLEEGKPFSQNPWALRVEATAETPLLTVDDMIARCDEGIYIHRLSDVAEIDRASGMQTGVTRDGCFLIKGGKIERPVKNFRFIDSPFGMLNRIVAIGKTERTAMGYMEPANDEPAYLWQWPRRPMIVPPLMIRDFNLTALADAV